MLERLLNIAPLAILAVGAIAAITHNTNYAILGIIVYLSMLQIKYDEGK